MYNPAKNRGMPHDFLLRLYDAARKVTDGRPISTFAAEKLMESVGRDDVVLFLTGAGLKPILPEGESDGPPGAAALARAVYRGFGAIPVDGLEGETSMACVQFLGNIIRKNLEAKTKGLAH